MQLHRIVLEWSGTAVTGRAVTVLHYDGSSLAAPPVATLKAAFNAQAALFPSGTNIVFPGTGDTIDDTTGNLTGVWTSSGGGTVAGSTVGTTTMGVGACLNWKTGGIVNARRLRGRTFLVPLAGNVWGPAGTFTSGALSTIGTLANAIQATGGLAVWHRPTTVGGSDGTSYGVLSNTVMGKPAVLTSRRD